MELYIQAFSDYYANNENIELKKELKKSYKVDIRRKDNFIFAGMLAALRLKEKVSIAKSDELYLTSGYGNIDILAKMNNYVLEEKEPIKLFDFINILGNTTNFYIAKELGIEAKSIFQISDNFTYFNSLISIYASISTRNNDAVFGAIDIVPADQEVLKRVAGITNETPICTNVSFQKLSKNPKNALCKLEFDTQFYSLESIKEIIKKEDLTLRVSYRCNELNGQKGTCYFETEASSIVNNAILSKEPTLFIEAYENRYKILKITPL